MPVEASAMLVCPALESSLTGYTRHQYVPSSRSTNMPEKAASIVWIIRRKRRSPAMSRRIWSFVPKFAAVHEKTTGTGTAADAISCSVGDIGPPQKRFLPYWRQY
jgi:hypothetical protein